MKYKNLLNEKNNNNKTLDSIKGRITNLSQNELKMNVQQEAPWLTAWKLQGGMFITYYMQTIRAELLRLFKSPVKKWAHDGCVLGRHSVTINPLCKKLSFSEKYRWNQLSSLVCRIRNKRETWTLDRSGGVEELLMADRKNEFVPCIEM